MYFQLLSMVNKMNRSTTERSENLKARRIIGRKSESTLGLGLPMSPTCIQRAPKAPTNLVSSCTEFFVLARELEEVTKALICAECSPGLPMSLKDP